MSSVGYPVLICIIFYGTILWPQSIFVRFVVHFCSIVNAVCFFWGGGGGGEGSVDCILISLVFCPEVIVQLMRTF